MLRAETLVGGRWFFLDCACKVLFNTNYSKIRLRVSQPEDLGFAGVPQHLILSLLLPPMKWKMPPCFKEALCEEINVIMMGPYKHFGGQSEA